MATEVGAAAAGTGAPAKGLEYTDTDGTVMEWDAQMRAYFPKLNQDVMAQYQMGYGVTPKANPWSGPHQAPNGHGYYYNSVTKESSWTMPAEFQQPTAGPAATGAGGNLSYDEMVMQERIAKGMRQMKAKPGGKIADDDDDDAPKAKKPKKMEKREDEGGFFQMEKKENSFVYIQGLPTEDFDEEKLVAFMSKCGVVAQDDKGVPKVKLYRSSDTGDLKGDGRLCYLKVESVNLCLTILDGTEIAPGHTVTITRAEFKAKAGYDPTQKPDKKKKSKKKGKLDQKQLQHKRLLGWHEAEDSEGVRKKAAGVVVIKHMFKPEQFDEDAMYLNDIRDDLQSECSKFGEVKKIMIFDRHPDGVVSIKFEDKLAAEKCLTVMNGRNFAGAKLAAEMWDGHTSYKIEESDLEREERMKKWEADLNEA